MAEIQCVYLCVKLKANGLGTYRCSTVDLWSPGKKLPLHREEVFFQGDIAMNSQARVSVRADSEILCQIGSQRVPCFPILEDIYTGLDEILGPVVGPLATQKCDFWHRSSIDAQGFGRTECHIGPPGKGQKAIYVLDYRLPIPDPPDSDPRSDSADWWKRC